MADLDLDLDLDPDLDLAPATAAIYAAYRRELEAGLAQLGPWWERLEASCSRKLLRLRWPGGVASHPRILAIYRDYHRRFDASHEPGPAGPEPRFDADAAWGSEAEAAPTSLIPLAPERLLIDRLQVEAPALYRKMIKLLLSPVGVAPEPKPSLRGLEVIEPAPRRAPAFHFNARHGVARGLERLLGAAQDLRSETLAPVARSEASEFHRFAHYAYQRDLERALAAAEAWWIRERLDRELRGMSEELALADCYASHPVGPVAHPRVLGVIQAYWALCEEINAVLLLQATPGIPPEQLLLDWLRDGYHESWVEALTALPYWPIGLDAQGAWI